MRAAGRSGRGLFAITGLLLLPAVLFFDVLFLGYGFFQRDLTRFFHPNARVFREIVLRGEFPYWNSYIGGGQPLAANPNFGVFYPPNWLLLLPDFERAFQFHLIVHIPLALIGMYLLLRSLGLRIESASFGAVSFGLSGLLLSYLNVASFLFTIAWMPLVLLFAIRLVRRPNLRDGAWMAFFFGLQLLAGEPTTILQTVVLILGYGLHDVFASRRSMRASTTRAAALGLALASGVAVAAVQLIPLLDLFGATERAGGLRWEMVSAWSLPPLRPLETLFAEIYGSKEGGGVLYWGSALYEPRSAPYVFDLYVGAAAAVCALAGIAARRRGAVAIAAGVAGSCLIALGDRTPLLRWLYDDGFFRSIRYPEKFILSAMFLVVIFGAITFDRMVAGDRRAIRLACGFATILGGVAAVAYVLSWTPSYARWFARTWSIGNPGAAESMIAISRAGWLHAGIRWAILLTLLLWLLRSIPAAAHGSEPTDQWLPSRLWYAAGALFLLFDLAFAPGRILERMPPEFFRKPPAASGLDDRYRLFHEAAILETVFREGPAVSGNRRQWIARNGLYPRSSAAWGIPMVYDGDYDLTNLEPTRKLFAALVEARQGATHFPEVFLSISNVGYVARHRRDPGGRISLQHPVEFERRRYPRYYLADQIVQIRDLREFLDMASRGSWSDRVAFVEFPPFPSAGGRVDVIEESANSVRLRVQSDGRGYLVIGITPHEYWRASVDGREVKLLPANVAYQGLVIPPGTHTIDMRYRNPLFFFGGGISGLALAGLIAVVAWPGRSRSVLPGAAEPVEPS